jgi:hypothetical protein
MNKPSNLKINEDADWRIKLRGPDGVHWLSIRGRSTWKRLTAISHARCFARRNPNYEVLVHIDTFDK